jgi:hypothetical protein
MDMRNMTILALVLIGCIGLLFRGGVWLGYGNSQAQNAVGNRDRYTFRTLSSGKPAPPLTEEEADLIAAVRAAGLKRDRTQLPLVRQALKESHRDVLITALLAAGRLGDSESVKQINTLANRHLGDTVGELSDAVLARIRTENVVGRATSTTALSRKVNHFLSETRLSKTRIEQTVRAFHAQGGAREHQTPYEVYALRQMADFVAEGYEAGVPNAAATTGLDFSLDPATQLKVRLAPMSKTQRINWLIESIARKKAIRGEDYYEVRALADEGTEAVAPILTKLRILKSNREGYEYPGISTLFNVLACIGDQSAIPVVRSFVGDSDKWLDHYARQQLQRLEVGFRKPYMVDF